MKEEMKRSDRDGHIIYKKICEYCKGIYWARKKDGRMCSNACRNLKMMNARRNKYK